MSEHPAKPFVERIFARHDGHGTGSDYDPDTATTRDAVEALALLKEEQRRFAALEDRLALLREALEAIAEAEPATDDVDTRERRYGLCSELARDALEALEASP